MMLVTRFKSFSIQHDVYIRNFPVFSEMSCKARIALKKAGKNPVNILGTTLPLRQTKLKISKQTVLSSLP